MAANQQGNEFTIQAVGGRNNLANIYETQLAQFSSIVGVGPQEGQALEEQAQLPGASFNVMQAKQGLDKREDAWRSIVGGGQEQGAQGGQNDAANLQFNPQQAMQNIAEQNQGAELDQKQDKITDDELKKVFGDQADAVRALLNKRSDVKLSELLPLRKDQAGFGQVLKTLTERSDVQVSDLVERTPDGKVKIESSVNDDETKELMENRNDIKPKELSNLKAQLTKALGNPMLAKKAFTLAMKLLKSRTDMKPEEVGNMFTGISEKIDSVQPKGDKSASGAGAKLEMFETAVELLTTRRDLNADHIVKLADSVTQTMGDKQDGSSPTRISQSFRDAADLMSTRKDISVDQVSGFLSSLQGMTKGKDPAALDNRASIFKSACNLLKTRPDMNFDSMTELLKRQTQGKNPKQGNALLKDFNAATTNLGKGQNMDQVAPPVTHQPDPKKKNEEAKKPGEDTGEKGVEDKDKKDGVEDKEKKDGVTPEKEEPLQEKDGKEDEKELPEKPGGDAVPQKG